MNKKESNIFTRVSIEERELLNKICHARGEDISDFVRRSVRKELARMGYLSEEEMKALEMLTEV